MRSRLVAPVACCCSRRSPSPPRWRRRQELEFHAPASPRATRTTPAVMRDLAERLLPVYQESDPDRYLANLSALQMVAGDYRAGGCLAAIAARSAAPRRFRPAGGPGSDLRHLRLREGDGGRRATSRSPRLSRRHFTRWSRRLSDHDAYAVDAWLEPSPPRVSRSTFQKSARSSSGPKDIIDQAEAVKLLWAYLVVRCLSHFGTPGRPRSMPRTMHRRYTAEKTCSSRCPTARASPPMVVRPKNRRRAAARAARVQRSTTRTTYRQGMRGARLRGRASRTTSRQARGATCRSLSARRRGCARGDRLDRQATLERRARGNVRRGLQRLYRRGLRRPACRRRSRPSPRSDRPRPGIDVPMAGNIFQNSAYRWSLQVDQHQAGARGELRATTRCGARSIEKWYRSGRRYRDLGRLYGKPNPIFIRWLNHPSYDRFWQKHDPLSGTIRAHRHPGAHHDRLFRRERAGRAVLLHASTIDTTRTPTIRCSSAPTMTSAMQRGRAASAAGYEVDSAALIDLRELRYQWFDHVLKGAARCRRY